MRLCAMGLLLFTAAGATVGRAAEFFVDPDVAGTGQDGSAAKPWPRLDKAAWPVINRALAGDDVTVFFSARSATGEANQLDATGVHIERTDPSTHRLTVDGQSRYNADDARPRWLPNAGAARMEIRCGYPLSCYTPGTKQDYVTLRGFKAVAGVGGRGGQALAYWGGSHVVIENCEFMHDPAASHGACVQFGYAWAEGGKKECGSCTDIVIRSNRIHDTFGEGIYFGGSGNTKDPATGQVRPAHSHVVIEGNVIFNTGLYGGEGDCIDIKDGNADVTVRNNLCHDNQRGNADGISSLSPITAESNVVYNVKGHAIGCGTYWGSGFSDVTLRHNLVFNNAKNGIYVSSDRDKPVTRVLIENNTLCGNRGAGLGIGVDKGGRMTELTVRDNIICQNGQGIGGYGRASYVMTGNIVYGNKPDYASPFRAAEDPTLAGKNMFFDPLLANPGQPAGPDGTFFTADDGYAATAAARDAGRSQLSAGYLPAVN